MAKQKVTITLDRTKADEAKSLLNLGSTSEAIEVALDAIIRAERLKRDIAAYRRMPPTEAERALGHIGPAAQMDDTDWEALYPVDEE